MFSRAAAASKCFFFVFSVFLFFVRSLQLLVWCAQLCWCERSFFLVVIVSFVGLHLRKHITSPSPSMWYKHRRWVAQCTRWNAQPTTECVRQFYVRISTRNTQTHTHQHDPPKYFVKNERQRQHEKEREETKYANEKSLVYVSNSNNVIEYRYAL